MKQLLLLLFAFLLFVSQNQVSSQCTSSIFLDTQTDVDNFVEDYGCSVIEGDLTIGTSTPDLLDFTDIDNLTALASITAIEGHLLIKSNNLLTSLDGLQNLTSVGNYLNILGNGIESLDGLQNLTSIGGHLKISSNGIESLDGLQNLISIGSYLTISDNENLTNFNGLNIDTIPYHLKISNNDALIDLSGLENITTVQGKLEISQQQNLTNFNGLQNLTFIEESLNFNYNDSLNSLNGLQNLTTIGGLSFAQNPQLINIDELQNITTTGSIFMEQNNGLTDLNGLQNLHTVTESLTIGGNGSLTNLNGLQNLNTLEGSLRIEDNNNLTSISELQNLNIIGGVVWIIANNNLTDLNGLQNINSIGGFLEIIENDNLTDISDLQNITTIGGILSIFNNVSLENCCSVPYLLEGVEGTILIQDNLPSCNSVEAIFDFCGGYQQIQVVAFFDENENGFFDENEQFLQQVFNLSPSPLYSFTDQSGVASLYLEIFGEYELFLNNSNPLWEFSGPNNPVQISFFDDTFSDTLHYFPMIPIANFISQNIDLSSSITRCNQETNYWLTYSNEGTTINDGYVELIPSNLTNLVSANPPADSTAGDTLFWFYDDLYPTHSKQIHLIYEMPSVDELGEQIAFEANIETNEGHGDHKAILSSELICAYDPNDKLVTPFGYGDENYTLFGDTLEYTVRFQNTGNDTAFTVIIEDELSEYLDLNTFRPIASSHNVETQVDLETRLATFTFNDIYLADSFVNEPASHGFVKYQILGNENLAENTDVKNTASIFFDQNPPIVTNTINNRLVSELPSLPILTASTDAIDFGTIGLDEIVYSAPQTLIIENLGDLDLIIESIEIQGTDFSIQVDELIIEGQTNAEIPIYFEPNEVGTYQGQVLIQSNVGELIIELSGTAVLETGLSSLPSHSFRLFPNPNEGLFYLESKEQKILSYQIINSLGEIVLEQKPNNVFTTIDLGKMGKGLYFVSIQTEEGSWVEKIIVQ